MANTSLGSSRYIFLYAIELLILMQAKIGFCYHYKVGELAGWGIPTSTNPDVYTKWSKNHIFRVGDSIFFLYPPSQDSVIQVTPQAYKACNLKDPILHMNDGNSLFNITQPGDFYFTSGEAGHCQKGQKLHIFIAGDGAIAYPPSYDPSADTAAGPSYANAFGSIPTASVSSPLTRVSALLASFIGFAIWVLA